MPALKQSPPSYDALVKRGVSPRLADMLASQQPPGTKGTDRAFMQGYLHDRWSGTPHFIAQKQEKLAKAAGIHTQGKVYKGGLADWRGPGDPMAWVSSIDDVKRVCEIKNLHCRGAVTHKAHDVPPPPDIPLAADIVERTLHENLAADPDKKPKTPKKLQEMREAIIDKHGSKP